MALVHIGLGNGLWGSCVCCFPFISTSTPHLNVVGTFSATVGINQWIPSHLLAQDDEHHGHRGFRAPLLKPIAPQTSWGWAPALQAGGV